jgi:cellulose synthase/poly-beta-1,6-N-acetylglucosamine synthase-like glycosyltransferase
LRQLLLLSEKPEANTRFSVGICAADHASGLEELIKFVEREPYRIGLNLQEIIVVASGLDPDATALIGALANQHHNLTLIEEPMRRGKAEAINRIIKSCNGEFLVLINSDAHPQPGAIATLLGEIVDDKNVGLVSASPVIGGSGGITGAVLKLMWELHNQCLSALNEADLNNHCCDELIIIRSKALRELPEDTVNDGAFMAGAAHRAGYTIRFCKEAKVRIDVPQRFGELIKQRRRIIYGHLQILRSVGESPRTLESMIFNNPRLGLSILIKTLAKSPKLILALPVAVVGEFVSGMFGTIDTLSSVKKHVPWDRVGRRA